MTLANQDSVVRKLLELPLFHASWVLWFLLALSLLSFAVIAERAVFFRKRRVDLDSLRRDFSAALEREDYDGAGRTLQAFDSLETNVTLFALREHASGPDAVESLIAGVAPKERERYEASLDLLATIASNAPFVGLFGTVLGIIRAFKDLAGNLRDATGAVMTGIAEALLTTAVGLFVAIPALVAFNLFKRRVKGAMNNANFLCGILLAHLKSR
jgi:biopolymer transport protein ExbB/TolQ